MKDDKRKTNVSQEEPTNRNDVNHEYPSHTKKARDKLRPSWQRAIHNTEIYLN